MEWIPTRQRKLEWAGKKHGLIGTVHKSPKDIVYCKVSNAEGKVFWRNKSQPHLIEGFHATEAMMDYLAAQKKDVKDDSV